MDPNQIPHQTDPRGSRRATVLGVSAGVIGGGLVGLAMTVPSFISAASDDTTDSAVAALQETDDTTTADTTGDDTTGDDTTGDDTTSDAGRVEAGTRLRELLQDLVDDGTLTAEQADAVTDHLVANREERGDHRPGRLGRRGAHPGMDGEVVAGLIGIDVVELRTALRDGQSIAEIAEANGVDSQTIVDALVAEAEGHLDLMVENGRLTEDEATEKLGDLTERITARVDGERPVRD